MGKARITIFDGNGRMVQQFAFDKQQSVFRQQLNVGGLASGLYYLNIQFNGAGKPYVFKIVKN
jgi:hypothetical protein